MVEGRAERYGLTYPAEIQKPLKLKQQDVCNGEWWGSVFYGGARCCVILSAYEREPEIRMSFPRLVDNDMLDFPTTGMLGQALWNIESEKPIVLDGYLGLEKEDMEWPNLKGRHLIPGTTFFAHDAIGLAAFKRGQGKQTFSKRRKRVGKVVRQADSETVRIASYKRITSKRDFNTLKREAKADGAYVMLRRDVPYRTGRSGNLLIWRPK